MTEGFDEHKATPWILGAAGVVALFVLARGSSTAKGGATGGLALLNPVMGDVGDVASANASIAQAADNARASQVESVTGLLSSEQGYRSQLEEAQVQGRTQSYEAKLAETLGLTQAADTLSGQNTMAQDAEAIAGIQANAQEKQYQLQYDAQQNAEETQQEEQTQQNQYNFWGSLLGSIGSIFGFSMGSPQPGPSYPSAPTQGPWPDNPLA